MEYFRNILPRIPLIPVSNSRDPLHSRDPSDSKELHGEIPDDLSTLWEEAAENEGGGGGSGGADAVGGYEGHTAGTGDSAGYGGVGSGSAEAAVRAVSRGQGASA